MATQNIESGGVKAQLKRTLKQPYTIALFTTLLAAGLAMFWLKPVIRPSLTTVATPSLNISVYDEAGHPVAGASLLIEGRQGAELADAAGIIRFRPRSRIDLRQM